MIKKLVLAILLAYSTSVSSQTSTVSTTGNIIDPNAWQGAIYMTPGQLSMVEGTGGGPMPAYNMGTNTIRFSFMPYTVSQIRAINAAMFNNNTNIQVSGYNYSWTLYGDNGYLNVLGKLYDTKGAVLEQASYNYMFSPAMPKNWELISGTSSFSTNYDLKTLGSVEFTATGSDSLFWSGYYGPRIRDVNISFNYSILPAPTSPISTTTTTNTAVSDAIAQATAPVITDTTTATTSATSTTTPITETVSTPTIQTTSTVATASTTSPVVSVVSNTVSPTVSSTSTSGSNNTASAPSLSSVLSMIRSNQEKENSIATTAVSQANQVAQAAVAKTEETALSVASLSSAQSLDIAKESTNNQSSNNTKSSSSNSGVPLLSATSNIGSMSLATQSSTLQQSQASIQINQLSAQNNSTQPVSTTFQLLPQNTTNYNQQPTVTTTPTTSFASINNIPQQTNITLPTGPVGLYVRPIEPIASTPVIQTQEIPTPQESKVTTTAVAVQQAEVQSNNNLLFAKRGDPLTDYIEQNNIMAAMSQPEIKNTTVKRDVQDNDLAAGIRIDRMAVVPTGYSAYTNYMLKDVAFYAPKEIYRNQKTVDNARALRQLSSDRLHQEMIEQQYRR